MKTNEPTYVQYARMVRNTMDVFDCDHKKAGSRIAFHSGIIEDMRSEGFSDDQIRQFITEFLDFYLEDKNEAPVP